MGDKQKRGRKDSKQKGEPEDLKEDLPSAQRGGMDKVYSAFIKEQRAKGTHETESPLVSKAGIRFVLPERLMSRLKKS